MIQLEVWGDYALFSRPELKVERMSCDVPTPSAARGVVEAIYYHPGLCWHIDRVYVLEPIRFVSVRRNEVDSKLPATAARAAAQGMGDPCLQQLFQDLGEDAEFYAQRLRALLDEIP